MRLTARSLTLLVAFVPSLALAAKAPKPAKATPAEAKTFIAKVNEELLKLDVKSQTAEWIKSNFITDDTERNAASVNEELLGYLSATIKKAMRFVGLPGLDA